MDSSFINPTLITAIATLLTAITALIKVFQVSRQGVQTHDKLDHVEANTNGKLGALQAEVAAHRRDAATPEELSARANRDPAKGQTDDPAARVPR